MGFPRQEYWSGLPFPSPSKYFKMNKGLAHFENCFTLNPYSYIVLLCRKLKPYIFLGSFLFTHKGTRLTLRQGSVWGEEDKIELQVTAEPVSAITMHCKQGELRFQLPGMPESDKGRWRADAHLS